MEAIHNNITNFVHVIRMFTFKFMQNVMCDVGTKKNLNFGILQICFRFISLVVYLHILIEGTAGLL